MNQGLFIILQMALLQEINLLRKLSHKNVIGLHEVYESSNNIHLVLDYLQGGELNEKMKNNKPLKEQDAVVIMRNLLESLEHIHSRNIIHRDLKPENLIFGNA